MRFNRIAAASAAAALTLGTTLVLPAVAGAQDTTTSTTEDTTTTTVAPVGPDVTQAVDLTLSCTAEPDFSAITGPLNFTLSSSTVLPTYALDGETVSFDTDFTLTLPEGLRLLAVEAGIDQLPVSSFTFNAEATGGVTGGPFSAAPTSFNIPVDTGVATISMSGDLTVTDENVTGVLQVVNPITMVVTVVLEGIDVPPLVVTCSGSPLAFASINGELPPTPPTTPTTAGATTTTASAAATDATPRYAG